MSNTDNRTPLEPDYRDIQFTRPENRADSYGRSGGSYTYTPGGTAAGMPEQKKKRLTKGKAVFLIVLLVALLLFGLLASGLMAGGGVGYPYIGVLYVEGTIGSGDGTYNQNWLLEQIKYMREDPDNRGMLLYVNSPGGSVYQTDEVYRAIKKYKKDTGCPVYSYFAEYAASGGYYLAADSDYITANRFTTTGSIGVYYGPMVDVSELIEKAGVKVEFIKAGANKAMGNSYTPLTDEQRAILQSEVDEIYNVFVDIVAEGRDMPKDKVIQIADGRSYTATKALENGLIDEIGTLSSVKSKMKKDTGVEDFEVFRYEPPVTLMSYLYGLANTFGDYAEALGKSETEKTMDYVNDLAAEQNGFMVLMQE